MNNTEELSLAILDGNEDKVRKLINSGSLGSLKHSVLTFCCEYDRQLLQLAAQSGYHEFFEVHLKLGADIDSTDINGLTSLHYACGAESQALVTTLLEYGCDVDRVSTGKFARRAIEFADEEVADIIRRHIVKLWAAGFSAYMDDSKQVEYCDEITDLTNQCREELEAMKKEKIGCTSVSYHDILTDSRDELAVYAKNKNILLFLNSDSCKERFPIYAGLLKGHIWRGIVRRRLLQLSTDVFLDYCDDLPVLPDVCVERILRYLSDNELRSFVRCYLYFKQPREHLLKILINRAEDLIDEEEEAIISG